MSSIDERIVQMEFDNSLFDKNVESSIKTLEKLNVALKMDGIDKNLADISSSVSKMDFSKVTNSIDSVQSKFSNLSDFLINGASSLGSRISRAISGEIDKTISTVTGSVKRLFNDLTVAPIRQGFGEYELKMGSVQTIMASTGAELGTVNKYLDELNTYADKTIYSFSDMTSNIGKFTNAGVDLDTAVKAIQGISNAAALAGAGTNEASRAMYNFSQALSMGAVQLVDWKSIENANMATKEFKQTLIDTAVEVGTLTKKGDQFVSTTVNAQGKVSDSFDAIKGFRDSLNHQWITTEVLTKALGRYADETDEIGKRAYEAATKVKTFSQLIDTLKEAVGSGWARTFELLLGDFEQAKELFTSISDVVGGFIENISNARNSLLEEVLGGTTKASEEAAEAIEGTGEAADKAASSFEEYRKIADEIMQGKWGDGADRINKLTEAGYEYDKAQAIVNHDILGWELNMENYADATEEAADATKDAADATKELADANEKSGRELLIESFANVARSAITIFRTLGEAWKQVFPPVTAEGLKNAIKSFHSFTQELLLNSTTVYKLRNVFKGLLAPISIVLDAVTGLARAVFIPLVNVAKTLGNWLLQILSPIGKFVAAIANAVHESDIFYNVISGIVGFFTPLFTALGDVGNSVFKTLSVTLYNVGRSLTSLGTKFTEFWNAFKETKGVKYFVSVFDRFGKTIGGIKDKAVDKITKFFDGFRNVKFKFPEFNIGKIAESAGEAVGKLGEKLEFARIKIKSFFDNIKVDESNPFHRLYTYFSNLSAQGIIDSVSDKLAKAKSAVREFFKETGIAAKAQSVFNNAITRIRDTAPAVFNGILNAFANVGNFILDARSKVGEFWNSFTETEGFKAVKDGVASAIKTALSALDAAGSGISNFFKSAFEAIGNFKMPEINMEGLSNGVSNAIEWIKERFESLKSTISGLFSGAAESGGNVLDSIVSFFTSIDLSNGIEKITEGLGKAKDAIVNFFSSIASIFGGKDVNAAPIDEAAKSAENLSNTIEKGKSGFDSFIDILGKIRETVDEVWAYVKPFLQDIAMLKLGFGTASMFKNIGKSFKQFGEVLESFAGIGKKISGTLSSVQEAIKRISKAEAREHNSKAILNIAIALGVLAASMYALGQLSWDQFKVAAAGIGVITAALILLMGAIRLFFGGGIGVSIGGKGSNAIDKFSKVLADFGKGITKALRSFGMAALILAFVAGIKLLIGAINDIAEMDGDTLGKGIIVIGILGTFITAATSIMSKFSSGVRKSLGSAIVMFAFVASIKLLIGAIDDIGSMSTRRLAKGIVVIAILGAVIKGLVKATKNMKKVKAGSLLALAAVIGVVAFALYKLTELDTGKLLASAGSLGIVIAAMAALTHALSKMQTSNIAASIVSMLGVGALLAEIAYILNMFTSNPDLDADKMLKVSESISLLMGTMGGLTLLSQKLGTAGFAGLGASAIGAVDIGAVTAILSTLFGLIGYGAGQINETTAAEIIKGLDLIGQIFEKVGEMFGKLAGGFVGGLIGSTLSGFTSALPKLATNLNTFVSTLGDLAGDNAPSFAGVQAIIDTVGIVAEAAKDNIVADALTFVLSGGEQDSSLAKLGEGLVEFAGYMQEYGKKIKGLDVFSVMSTSFAIQTVMAFANAVPPSGGLYDMLVGSQDLDIFGKKLIPFALAMRGYSAIIGSFGGINEGAVTASTRCGTMLADLANAIPADSGFLQLLMGHKDLSKFGGQLTGFGEGLVGFAEAISKDGVSLSEDATKNATAVAGILAEFAKTSIDPTGGVLQWLMGTKDIGVFGGQASTFGTGIAEFAKAISEDGVTFDQTATENVTAVASMLAALGKEVAPSGGLLQWLMGEQDLGTFGSQLPGFGEGLKTFAENMAGFKAENITGAVDAITGLLDVLGILHAYGVDSGASSFYVDQGSFDSAMSAISEAITTFHDSITSEANTQALEDIKTSAEELGKKISQALVDGITNGINTPGEKGSGEGSSAISRIINSLFSKTDTLSADIEKLGAVKNISSAISSAIAKGINEPAETAIDLTTFLTAIADGVTAGEDSMITAGETLASAIASGILSARGSASSAGYYTGLSGASGARGAHSAFYSAGAYMGDGLVSGLNSKLSAVRAAAASLANEAATATRAAVRVQSPSRVYMEIGAYMAEGMAIGIADATPMAITASEDMAVLSVGSAEDALKNRTDQMFKQASLSIAAAYAYINEVANQSLDSQPVITPVLDMTNLQNGMYSMGSLWNMSLNNPFAYANTMFPGSYQYANTVRATNDFVTQTELRGIRSDLKQLGEAITNMNMVLDSGTLVGQLTPGIDRGLGSIAGMKERWA